MLSVSIMQIPTTRVDKATFKQIFRDSGEAFWQRYGHYLDVNVRDVVDKMLGCGDLASGYRCDTRSHRFKCLNQKGSPIRPGKHRMPVSVLPGRHGQPGGLKQAVNAKRK